MDSGGLRISAGDMRVEPLVVFRNGVYVRMNLDWRMAGPLGDPLTTLTPQRSRCWGFFLTPQRDLRFQSLLRFHVMPKREGVAAKL